MLKKKCTIALIDDEKDILEAYQSTLRLNGFKNLTPISDSTSAMSILEKNTPDLILLDLSMPGISGLELLPLIKAKWPFLPVIVISGLNQIEDAVASIKEGALDYLTKPVESSKLIAVINEALPLQHIDLNDSDSVQNPDHFKHIKTESPVMVSLFCYMEFIAQSTMPLLIEGESGTGKELFAKAYYNCSLCDGTFVAVNVAGLDDTLFSDTLFGHVKGAFTGAKENRSGLIKSAENGVLFLDEIGDLSQASQLKLLRLLQEREYSQVGSDKTLYSNCKIVAATNVNLKEKIEEGSFRADLYYRLKTHRITIPPLRQRKGDYPILVKAFVDEAAEQLAKKAPFIPKEIYPLLECIPFPGNVRELHSLIIDTMARHQSGIVLSLDPIKEYLAQLEGKVEIQDTPGDPGKSIPLDGDEFPKLKEVENILVEEALKKANNNQSAAAKLLGISQSKISRKLNKK